MSLFRCDICYHESLTHIEKDFNSFVCYIVKLIYPTMTPIFYFEGELIIGREYMRELAVVHRDFESGLTENGAQAVDGKVRIII